MKRLVMISSAGLVAIVGMWLFVQSSLARANARYGRPAVSTASAPQQGIGSADAVDVANLFLKAIGTPAPGEPSRVVKRSTPFGEIWDIQWSDRCTMLVDSLSGYVRLYEDSERVHDQVHRKNHTGLRVIATKEAAENWARDMAAKLKFRGEAFVENIDIYDDDDPDKTDGNKIGKATVALVPRPFGYPLIGRLNGITFDIDPQDGRLVTMFQNWDVEIMSHDPKTAKEAATATAQDAYESYYSTRSSPRRGKLEGSKAPQLGYVVSNGTFGSKLNEASRPYKARLAWVVYFGEEAVWIDAGDGAVLGGVRKK